MIDTLSFTDKDRVMTMYRVETAGMPDQFAQTHLKKAQIQAKVTRI